MSYANSYSKLGFTVIKSDEEKPKCVLRCTVLAFTSLKLNKLKRYLKKHHHNSFNKNVNLFKQKAEALIKSRFDHSKMFWKTL